LVVLVVRVEQKDAGPLVVGCRFRASRPELVEERTKTVEQSDDRLRVEPRIVGLDPVAVALERAVVLVADERVRLVEEGLGQRRLVLRLIRRLLLLLLRVALVVLLVLPAVVLGLLFLGVLREGGGRRADDQQGQERDHDP
jgi:hypothetical protein